MANYLDEYGRFDIEAEIDEGGLFYQFRKYDNSPAIKRCGGMWAIWCENGRISFYRNSYIRDRALPKFIDSVNA